MHKENQVLFQTELEQMDLPGRQMKRILDSKDSEDLLTWNIFATLKRSQPLSRWLVPWLQTCFTAPPQVLNNTQIHLWPGRQRRPTYPTSPEWERWLRERYRQSPIPLLRVWADKKGRMEGKTEIDVAIENDEVLIFVEAKYLSDISDHVTYDPWRDQIARCIDVGTYHAKGRAFFFILLTPRWPDEYAQNSRLYHYKLREYQQNPAALRTKLPHRVTGESPIDFELMSQCIAQAYWDDLINRADEQVKQGNILDISTSDWQQAMEDFRYKGLVQ